MSASVLKAEPDNLRVFMTTHKVRSHGVVFALWIASLSGRCGGAKYLTAAPDEAADAEVEVQLLQTKSALVGNSPVKAVSPAPRGMDLACTLCNFKASRGSSCSWCHLS